MGWREGWRNESMNGRRNRGQKKRTKILQVLGRVKGLKEKGNRETES